MHAGMGELYFPALQHGKEDKEIQIHRKLGVPYEAGLQNFTISDEASRILQRHSGQVDGQIIELLEEAYGVKGKDWDEVVTIDRLLKMDDLNRCKAEGEDRSRRTPHPASRGTCVPAPHMPSAVLARLVRALSGKSKDPRVQVLLQKLASGRIQDRFPNLAAAALVQLVRAGGDANGVINKEAFESEKFQWLLKELNAGNLKEILSEFHKLGSWEKLKHFPELIKRLDALVKKRGLLPDVREFLGEMWETMSTMSESMRSEDVRAFADVLKSDLHPEIRSTIQDSLVPIVSLRTANGDPSFFRELRYLVNGGGKASAALVRTLFQQDSVGFSGKSNSDYYDSETDDSIDQPGIDYFVKLAKNGDPDTRRALLGLLTGSTQGLFNNHHLNERILETHEALNESLKNGEISLEDFRLALMDQNYIGMQEDLLMTALEHMTTDELASAFSANIWNDAIALHGDSYRLYEVSQGIASRLPDFAGERRVSDLIRGIQTIERALSVENSWDIQIEDRDRILADLETASRVAASRGAPSAVISNLQALRERVNTLEVFVRAPDLAPLPPPADSNGR
jgi:hypothetical protein